MQLKEYTFKDKKLLQSALTHPSVSDKDSNYERMELLGDKILSAVIADIVYKKFKDYSEGELSVVLANLVNSNVIVDVATELNLGKEIILSNGEEISGGRTNPSNLENALEALIAAIYLDSDFETVKSMVSKWWARFFLNTKKLFQKDYKTQLQEVAQRKYGALPLYKTERRTGKAHDPIFTISVSLSKYKLIAQGKTKKEAEQKVASEMLDYVNIRDE